MADTQKEPNYTVEMEARLLSEYKEAPTRETVDRLALELNRTYRSVIAKLSNMGVYIAPPRTTKAGQPIVKKEELVAEIMEKLEVDAPSLVKANKQDLLKLVKVVRNL